MRWIGCLSWNGCQNLPPKISLSSQKTLNLGEMSHIEQTSEIFGVNVPQLQDRGRPRLSGDR